MSSIDVKRGDKYPIFWTINMDIEGGSTRLLARKGGETVELAHEQAGPRTIQHDLDGTLSGVYQIEVELTTLGGEVVTFPSKGYGKLRVLPDLG